MRVKMGTHRWRSPTSIATCDLEYSVVSLKRLGKVLLWKKWNFIGVWLLWKDGSTS